MKPPQCQCCDPDCPHNDGREGHDDCTDLAVVTLWRIDMEDNNGTAFCDTCADDAMASGVFTYKDRSP